MSFQHARNQCFGEVGLTLATGASRQWSTTGSPTLTINGTPDALSARAAANAGTTDSVSGEAAPAVKPGEYFAVVVTAGFTGSGGAQEFGEVWGNPGQRWSQGALFPGHCPKDHVPVGYFLFHNTGASDWNYGTNNFNASGLKKQAYDVTVLPPTVDWTDVR